jgi:inositol-1,3,4-trisphosphate 5/6-kinase / inositol-tetrakisphosphate 1-kinase
MVSGGSVGTEGEGDPAAAVERDEVVLAPARELVVGYALTSKKAKSFLQPKLRGLAR